MQDTGPVDPHASRAAGEAGVGVAEWAALPMPRRRLMAVLGGTVAYLAAPARWEGAQIHFGMLPAHADTSGDGGPGNMVDGSSNNDGGQITPDRVPPADGAGDARPDTAPDSFAEAGPDAGPDAVAEAGPDAGPDAIAEAGPDAVAEAGPDAGPDAVRENGPEAGPDAMAEAGPDAGPEPTVDAAADTAPTSPTLVSCADVPFLPLSYTSGVATYEIRFAAGSRCLLSAPLGPSYTPADVIVRHTMGTSTFSLAANAAGVVFSGAHGDATLSSDARTLTGMPVENGEAWFVTVGSGWEYNASLLVSPSDMLVQLFVTPPASG